MKMSHHVRTALFAMALIPAALNQTVLAAAVEPGDGGDADYRTFYSDGKVDLGKIGDSYTADLVMYLAGNQFMVVEDLMKGFLKKNPNVKAAFVETIPPGQILSEQLLVQGEINGKKIAMNPDVYASVDVGHLKKLKSAGKMDQYLTYTHNKLELMVAAGNPKGIKGADDLKRDDIVQSHPNPLTEGIFKFYGSEMLKDLGIHDKVTGGKECKGCWAVANKTWFTERHHRETPERIEKGEADVGIVWATEVAHAKATGRKVDGVAINAPLNKQDKAGYVVGAYKDGRNAKNAAAFLAYLSTDEAQNIYAKYGFAKASADDLKVKAIPDAK
ncbi:MAG: substrate-binding domain-containing protein [Gammaproteobacteria bacterium]|nr:substrate-binding domain-containing protein [Gammaproteobacteria bacterium]